MNLKPTQNTAFCALLLAAIAAIPTQAFADSPLAKLYNTDSSTTNKTARESDRFPRARYQKGDDRYVWGDMQLDVRPGETIECSVNVTNATKSSCFFTPSSSNFKTFLTDKEDVTNTSYQGVPDAVKIGWKATYPGSTNAAYKLNEAFAHLNLSETSIGVNEAKGGRLWAYVWDFNTSWKEDGFGAGGKVGEVKNYLNTSFFARLPNGNPIEIKLDNVSGDAFSVAGYQNLSADKSASWFTDWGILDLNTLSSNYISDKGIAPLDEYKYQASAIRKNLFQQGDCDADNWGEYNYGLYHDTNNKFKMYYSGKITDVPGQPSDNNARKCFDFYYAKIASHAPYVPLYLEKPEFLATPKIRLGNVTVTQELSTGPGDTCVFPIVTPSGTIPTKIKISGLGGKAAKSQLVCVNIDKPSDKKVSLLDIDSNGEIVFDLPINNIGRYKCYLEKVEKFSINFADTEQVGSMRMYEVASNGARIPLTLNWNDTSLSKPLIHGYYDSLVFALPVAGKTSPIHPKEPKLSASFDATEQEIECSSEPTLNARCWGNYADKGDPNNKKAGIGNGALVLTWTYYPVSERFPFLLTVTDQPVDPQELTNGCSDGSIDPKTGKKDAKYKPTDSDTDGIPDVVEGRPGIKVEDHPADPEHPKEIPGPNTDGDKNEDGSEKPDYDDRDSDGDGIPDKIECHFDPSHTGYGYVNGCEDTDHDGIPDYKDTDSDNDGVPDNIECIWIQTNATNYIDGCIVSDPGVPYIPDFKNPAVKGGPQPGDGDTDGDGIPDKVENKGADPSKAASNHGGKVQPGYDKDGNVDTDNDGIPDYKDTDSDNDGIPDKVECPDYATAGKCRNSDAPGTPDVTKSDEVPDYKDTDSDGDDTPDNVECIYDASNNGLDYIEGCIVTTGDNIPDYRNPKKKQGQDTSPNDGLPDRIQDSKDSDGDGIPDGVECPEYKDKTTPRVGPIVNGCPDTDGDGVPDYKDTDSDNDGIPDKVENKDADTSKKGKPGYDKYGNVDTDGDGLPDYKDTDSDGDGIPDKVENTPDPSHGKTIDVDGDHSPDVIDSDGDGLPDYRDTNSDNPSPGLPGHNPDDPSDSEECHYDSSIKSTATEKYVNGCISTESPNNVPDYRNNNAKGDDKDRDGIPDRVEKGPDPSKPRETTPGKQDYDNKDSDGDGIPDKFECPNWSPLNVGDHYVDGCPDSDGDGKPDYRDTDSNNDGTPDSEQCQYDATSNQCKVGTPTGFGKGGYRHKENTLPPVPGGGGNGGNGNNGPNGGDSSFGGIIAGGCGCAAAGGSAPLSSGLVSLLLTALGIFGIRRRRNDA